MDDRTGVTLAGVRTDIERTPDGRRLCVTREIDAPAERLWDLLTDTTRWPEWGPSIRDVDCPDRYISTGTSGHVTVVGGLDIPFQITACSDRRWTWDVARIPATGHRVAGEDPCTVTFEIPVLAAGYAPVCVRALGTLDRIATDGS